jgi:hypothetical protein
MASDGPPWVVGANCTLALRHAAVNGNVAHGFYVKPDSWRVLLPKVWYRGTNLSLLLPAGPLPAGKRVLEGVVVCRNGLVHADGAPSHLTAQQWHAMLLAYLARVNEGLTLVDPAGASWAAAVEEVEDRLAPLGGQWLLEWETRVVFVEM